MKITGETKVLGIFGYPVRHTLSPLMQNAAIETLKLDYIYVPFEVRPEGLKAAVGGIKSLGIAGVNVTIPHKEKAIPLLDEATEDASVIGSVNTVENRNGRLIGHNTDWKGYTLSLRKEAGFDPKGKMILVIGAGGAARGVIAGLSMEGATDVLIANRTVERGEALAVEFREKFKDVRFSSHPLSALKEPELLSAVDLIVNTTSVGMEGEPLDVEFRYTPAGTLVSDIIYKPQMTSFLKKAEDAGRRTIGGLGMLLYQGALSFEIWTSRKAPIDDMRKALTSALAVRK